MTEHADPQWGRIEGAPKRKGIVQEGLEPDLVKHLQIEHEIVDDGLEFQAQMNAHADALLRGDAIKDLQQKTEEIRRTIVSQALHKTEL